MPAALFLSILLASAAPAATAESAQCDAKPFTFGKPVPANERPHGSTNKPAAKPKELASTSTKPESRLIAPCDAGKKQKSKKKPR